jgi:phage terminase large subunit
VAEINVGYTARNQFIPFHRRTQRFACIVAHRRAGKTVACIHDLLDHALRSTLVRPRFIYVAPFRTQAKSVAWDYIRAASSSLGALGVEVNQAELWVGYSVNSSQIRLHGADNPDALRGAYYDGVIFDEYADMDPRTWTEVVRPALADRKGWAAFIGTPRGHNQFYEIYRNALKNPDEWYSLELKASQTNLVDELELASSRKTMTEEQYQQEYECNFEAAIQGAYYGRHMAKAEEEKRICGVPHEKACRVWTAWDLGFRDATSVWFFQMVGKEVHLIDYHESTNVDIAKDVQDVLAKKDYNYQGHILPHDAYATSKQTGRTTADIMSSLGLANIQRCPDHRIQDGITTCQLLLNKCWFDKVRCERGIEALKQYRTRYDERRKTFAEDPYHDWSSHAADAFRYLAVGVEGAMNTGNFNRKIIYKKRGIV